MLSPIPKSTGGSATAPRFGRHGPRSRNGINLRQALSRFLSRLTLVLGCTTCRTRKVKCDETRDVCNRCSKAQIHCEWDQPVRNRRPAKGPQVNTPDKSSAPASPASLPSTEPIVSPLSVHWTNSTTPVRSADNIASESIHDVALGNGLQVDSPVLTSTLYNASLSPEELESFEYIPRSFMVLRFGKPWRWSMLCYVHSTVARREQGVMRAFIAVASMELRSRELNKLQDVSSPSDAARRARAFKTNARVSLDLAMQDLSHVLKAVFENPNDPELLDVLFTMWFLILHFGIYDCDLVDTSYMHLDGIKSFLAEYFHGSSTQRIYKLPPASTQLLLFIWSVQALPQFSTRDTEFC